jgi:hypothetical protein
MADPNQDEIVVELESPEVVQPEIKVEPVETKTPKPEIAPEEGIEALKAKLAEEQKAREAESAARREAEARAVQAQGREHETNLSLVTSAIERVKEQQASLKTKYAEAAASGNWDEAADIQIQMADNSAKALKLEEAKQSLSERPKPQASDPVEQLAGQLSPRSAAWVRAHPEFARDPRQMSRMVAAHNLAVGDGIEPDSDAYFEAVETTLRLRQPKADSQEDPTSSAAQPVQRRAAPPEAPVSRPSGANGTRPNVVRLTAAEREIAQMMGMDEKDYARNKLALQREGKMH